MAYQDKLMMLNKPLYKTILKEYNISDNNIGSKIKLLFLDDNGI